MTPTLLPFLLLLVGGVAVSTEFPFEVQNIDDTAVRGLLTALHSDTLALQTEDGPLTLPLDQVAVIKSLLANPFIPIKQGAGAPLPKAASASPYGMLDGIYINGPASHPSMTPSGRAIKSLFENKENAESSVTTFPEQVILLELSEGSRMIAKEFTVKKKSGDSDGIAGRPIAQITLLSDVKIELPLPMLSSVRFAVKKYEDIFLVLRDWEQIGQRDATKGDRLVVGQPGSLDTHQGIVAEINADTVSFLVDGDTLPVPRRKIFGIFFHRATADTISSSAPPAAKIYCWDGSILRVHSLILRENGALFGALANGTECSVPLTDVGKIELTISGMLRLLDLTPILMQVPNPISWDAETKSHASLAVYQKFRENRLSRFLTGEPNDPNPLAQLFAGKPADFRDEKVVSKPIPSFVGVKLDHVFFERGVVLPANSEISFNLKEPFGELRAFIGVDDRLRPGDGNTLRLRIIGDNKILAEEIVRGVEPGRQIRVPLAGVHSLTFQVTGQGTTPIAIGDPKLLQ